MPLLLRAVSLWSFMVLSSAAARAQAPSPSFVTGFNQGWTAGKDSYSRSFSDGHFDEAEMRKLMRLNKEAGGSVLRLWLFEGSSLDQMEKDASGKPIGIKPDVLANYRRTLQIAREEGVQVYLTLFDANVAHFDKSNKAMRDRYWRILNDKDGHGQAFREKVLGPVLDASREEGGLFGVDLVNEGNLWATYIPGVVEPLFEKKWEGLNKFNKEWGDFVRSKGAKATMSQGWPIIATPGFFDGSLNLDHLDFFDVHAYNNHGGIPDCAALGKLAKDKGKPIYLGEFGQLSKAYDDNLQSDVTLKFLNNARNCGFSGALAWRLDENRPAEKRLGFVFGDSKRPAYGVIRDFNKRIGNLVEVAPEEAAGHEATQDLKSP
jgi:hypothetical protein